MTSKPYGVFMFSAGHLIRRFFRGMTSIRSVTFSPPGSPISDSLSLLIDLPKDFACDLTHDHR
jgi:hypothetical protein